MKKRAEKRSYERGRQASRLDGHDVSLHVLDKTLHQLVKLNIRMDKHIQKLAINASNTAESTKQLAAALKIEKDDAAAALKTEKDDAAAALKTGQDMSSGRWTRLQTVAAFGSTTVGFLGYEYLTHPHG